MFTLSVEPMFPWNPLLFDYFSNIHIYTVYCCYLQGDSGEVERACLAAIDAGYRHIDCAWIYGNQDGVGRAVATKIKEGVIKREDLFITTKVCQLLG